MNLGLKCENKQKSEGYRMELIDNTTKTLRDDLTVEIKKGSKLSIAAACFSIYAFQELKKELQGIE